MSRLTWEKHNNKPDRICPIADVNCQRHPNDGEENEYCTEQGGDCNHCQLGAMLIKLARFEDVAEDGYQGISI
jgi:hypothetical protein